MQAQWPSAPYVGIWTRTTSFRRGTLERELAKGSVLKANLMRQTLHLVTRRDYGLLRAAISESGHPDQWPNSIKVAPSVRALAERGPVTMAEGLELLEREHGLTGITARRAWHGGRMRAHVLHHHETALWGARPEGRFVAIEEPEPVEPVEARAEMLARYLAAFGPASRKDMDAWSMMRQPAIKAALARLELRRFRDERGLELLDVRARSAAGSRYARSRPLPPEVGQRPARVRRPDACAPRGVPQDGDRVERRRRADVPRRRARCRDVERREAVASSSSRWRGSPDRFAASSRTRPNAWRRSSPTRCVEARSTPRGAPSLLSSTARARGRSERDRPPGRLPRPTDGGRTSSRPRSSRRSFATVPRSTRATEQSAQRWSPRLTP